MIIPPFKVGCGSQYSAGTFVADGELDYAWQYYYEGAWPLAGPRVVATNRPRRDLDMASLKQETQSINTRYLCDSIWFGRSGPSIFHTPRWAWPRAAPRGTALRRWPGRRAYGGGHPNHSVGAEPLPLHGVAQAHAESTRHENVYVHCQRWPRAPQRIRCPHIPAFTPRETPHETQHEQRIHCQ